MAGTGTTVTTTTRDERRNARKEIKHSQELLAHCGQAMSRRATLHTQAQQHSEAVRQQLAWARLVATPIEELRSYLGPGLRLGQLSKYGYTSVADVAQSSPQHMMAVPGVGQQTAFSAHRAATDLWNDQLRTTRLQIDPRNPSHEATALVRWLVALGAFDEIMRPLGDLPTGAEQQLPDLISMAKKGSRWWSTRRRREAARPSVESLANWSSWSARADATATLQRAHQVQPPYAHDAWNSFIGDPAHYYALLEQSTGVAARGPAESLPKDIRDRINALKLRTDSLRVQLRQYQVFGAKFGVVQKKVLLGDEMGLGKTIQALAWLSHWQAEGERTFLVICPASVLINWQHEISRRSSLPYVVCHGPNAREEFDRWQRSGGVAVTTYDTLKRFPAAVADAIVVDEAHLLKNRETQRAQAAGQWFRQCPRVLFLTGTPMENRVEEFLSLVGQLQPDLPDRLHRQHFLGGPEAFRHVAAPVYLRRNQEQVLTELPEKVQVDEWLAFNHHDGAEYRRAVQKKNYMAARQAAYRGSVPTQGAKVQRMLEIVADARSSGRKVIVFSFYRDVLDTVAAALDQADVRYCGPLTGSTTPARRQQLVEQLGEPNGPDVLISQIIAGGQGLNIQAASVVILCEPQVKPSLEDQAIARAHRMGQLETVQVHRLLVEGSVDERMLELLSRKKRDFETYVDDSPSADLSPAAKSNIMAFEFRRLFGEQAA